ncbi:MAG: NAD(P)-binding protein, partial [Pikeienuella sp.]
MAKQKTASGPKKKIAILGGGPSSLVAAFRLTELLGDDQAHEITIYQQGWRVGGKCATGRDLDRSKRVYEHGIHGFLGCYYNALTVMKRVFDSLGRPKDHPVPDFESAFHGMSGVIRYEMEEGKLKKWPIFAPPDWHGAMKDPAGPEPTLAEMVALAPKLARIDVWVAGLIRIGMGGLLQAYARTFRNLETYAYILKTQTIPPLGGAHPMVSDPLKGRFDTRINEGEEAFNAAIGRALAQAKAASDAKDVKTVAAVFATTGEMLARIVEAGGGGDESTRDRLRRLSLMLDFFAAIIRGVLADRIMTRGFAVIDRLDHVEWLRKHGATEATINSPLTSSTPNITYQYPEGDSLRPPVMAAGAW